MNIYVCPDCKTPLEELYCNFCGHQYQEVDGIPLLLSRDPTFASVPKITTFYDSLYQRQRNVWVLQGRTPQFISYFASFLERWQPDRFLEIGCGEGFLLAAVRSKDKFAVDISEEALKISRGRATANFSAALAERLPFPPDSFDLVATVGVMEHFIDDNAAIREIRRVLKPGGHLVTLIHVNLTFWERLGMKVSQYMFPRPRPVQFIRWATAKLLAILHKVVHRERPKDYIRQPVYNRYTTRSARARYQSNGLTVVDVIHTRRYPNLPLIGPHVVIYVARK